MIGNIQTLLANTDTIFNFDRKGISFLVLNRTQDEIEVQFGTDTYKPKVPAQCSRFFQIPLKKNYSGNYIIDNEKGYDNITVNSPVGGEVEIQCIEY